MKLTLVRDIRTPRWTLGMLWVDGKFCCYTVEDCDRLALGEAKLAGVTAILAGVYEVKFTWSPKYQVLMPEVMRVPGFRGIRIHSGNDDGDTEGCILPGLSRNVQLGKVYYSASVCRWLYERIRAAADTTLEIRYDVPAGFEPPPT